MPKPACPWTGLSRRQLDDLGEPAKGPDGKFNPQAWPGCNIFNPNSMAAAAGFKEPSYFRDKVLGTSSLFHLFQHHDYEVTDDGCEKPFTVYATHVNSLKAGGDAWREIQHQNARARGLAAKTDVSAGSCLEGAPSKNK